MSALPSVIKAESQFRQIRKEGPMHSVPDYGISIRDYNLSHHTESHPMWGWLELTDANLSDNHLSRPAVLSARLGHTQLIFSSFLCWPSIWKAMQSCPCKRLSGSLLCINWMSRTNARVGTPFNLWGWSTSDLCIWLIWWWTQSIDVGSKQSHVVMLCLKHVFFSDLMALLNLSVPFLTWKCCPFVDLSSLSQVRTKSNCHA
jgi:hypothetical protein